MLLRVLCGFSLIHSVRCGKYVWEKMTAESDQITHLYLKQNKSYFLKGTVVSCSNVNSSVPFLKLKSCSEQIQHEQIKFLDVQ